MAISGCEDGEKQALVRLVRVWSRAETCSSEHGLVGVSEALEPRPPCLASTSYLAEALLGTFLNRHFLAEMGILFD